ncbi:MAG: hypothetical protein WKF84_16790 [Pyrinomonadaceae bacterium]
MSQRAKVLVSVDGTIVQWQTQGDVEVEVLYWNEFDYGRQSDQNLSKSFSEAFPETAKMLDDHQKEAKNTERKTYFLDWASRLLSPRVIRRLAMMNW